MVSTVVSELFGLVVCGVVTLVFWPLGWLPDSAFFFGVPVMFAAGPVSALYRAGPPRRLAAVAAFLATLTVTLLLGIAAGRAFPPLADQDVGSLAGFLIGAPVGAGVFVWLSNRANVA